MVRGGRLLEDLDFGWLGFGVRWQEESLRLVSVGVVPFWHVLSQSSLFGKSRKSLVARSQLTV